MTVRIGIYGGAFDPPHRAHVGLACSAVQQLRLHRLYVVPTGQPWMKQRQLTAPAHRLAMAQLAFADLPQVRVDDCEIRRVGPTYTMDTLLDLQRREAAQASEPITWYLIMGQDLLQSLPRWERAEALFASVTVAVLQRPGPGGDALDDTLQRVRGQLPALHTEILQLPPSSISSTQIRQGLYRRRELDSGSRLAWLQTLVPNDVAQYIEAHQLYLTSAT